MASLFAEEDDGLPEDIDDIDGAVDEAVGDGEEEELTPRNNPDLLGHEEVEAALLRDFNAGRLPHAIVLFGPEGIGKATLAYRLARFLFTQGAQGAGLFGEDMQPESLYVAPENPVFRRVASGGHADMEVVEREFDEKKGRLKNDISIGAVRRIQPLLRKTAAEGGWRVVIVDSAEHLNHSSQNGLLKILEEPPKQSVLILTTSQPGAFLPTIRSRCRMIQMEPLSDRNVATLLDKMAPGLPAAEKSAICHFAEGSIGKALQFHANGGVQLYRELLSLVTDLPEMNIAAVHDVTDKITRGAKSDSGYETAREILSGWCQRVARQQARGEAVTDVLPGDADIFSRIAGDYPPHHFLETWEKMSQLFHQTDQYNLDKRQALIGALLMLQKPGHAGLSV
ncbi:MAG: DNA polymerase III subunit delta' [Alphaproteobacteria bacterium]|nr:DNA polymerase III subunit delta' [Alphaproteobacteria bacterium]